MIGRKVRIAALLAIGALCLSAPALYAATNDTAPAQEKGFTKKMEAKRQQLYKELNLSDEQKKLLEENRNKHKEQMKALFSQMKEERLLIRDELKKDTLDTGKIYQINNELKKMQGQLLDYRLESILEVRKILTPEQFKKFAAKIEERAEHFKDSKAQEKEGR